MGTILASTLISKVATILFDINGLEWSQAELLGWLNDGQRQIVMLEPLAGNTEVAMQMVAGTKQTIPAGGWTLIDIHRNVAPDGVTPGRAVRVVARKILDAFDPNWHSANPVTTVKNYVFDSMDRLGFWVSPPSDGTGYLWISYAAVPADLPNISTAITLNDIYATMLQDYMLYRAFSKRAEFADAQKAVAYWTAFTTALTGKTAAEASSDPNLDIAHSRPPSDGAT